MIGRRPVDPCTRHQEALLDFVDRRAAGPTVERALRHLERCATCEANLAATALILTALRRMFDEARRAEPPPDAWPRLKDRVAHRRETRRSATASPATGMLVGAALVVALVAPFAGLRPVRATFQEAGTDRYMIASRQVLLEERWLRLRIEPLVAARSAPAPSIAEPGQSFWRGPDGLGVPLTTHPTPAPAPPDGRHD